MNPFSPIANLFRAKKAAKLGDAPIGAEQPSLPSGGQLTVPPVAPVGNGKKVRARYLPSGSAGDSGQPKPGLTERGGWVRLSGRVPISDVMVGVGSPASTPHAFFLK